MAYNPQNPNGQATMANSAPVVLPSDQQVPVYDFDIPLGQALGATSYGDRQMAQSYTVLADSIADGLASFWTQTNANGGTVAVTSGEGLIQTSANAAGSAQIVSTSPSYWPGQQAWFMAAARFGDTGSAGNVRRVGAFTVSGTTPQDGFYFELNGTTLNAVSVKAGTPTAIASTSWSRFAAAPFTLDLNYHLLEIRWTANSAFFYIDGVLRHVANGGATAITTTLNLPMAAQSINSSGATNRLLAIRNIGLGRRGFPDTSKVTNRVDSLAYTSGTITSAASTVTATTDIPNAGTVTVVIAGTYAGVNVSFEASIDGTNWVSVLGQRTDAYVTETTSGALTNTIRAWDFPLPGFQQFRVRSTAWTSGTAAIIIAPAVNAFEIAPTTGLAAGTNDVGSVIVRNNQIEYEVDVPGLTTVAYTAGDQFGTLITIPNAARAAGGTGFINGIMYHDDEAKIGAIDIIFFNDTPTLAADNAAFAVSDADARKIVWWGNLTYLNNIAALARYGQLQGISVPYFCTATSLYVAIIVRTSPTALTATTSQRIRFLLSRD